jgi:hypothetical protein
VERRTLTGAVTVGDDHVRVGERVIARKEARYGVFEPGPPMQLVVMTAYGELAMAMPDAETAKASLRALGIDVERRAARFQRISADTRRQYVLTVVMLMGCVAGLFAGGFRVHAPALYLALLVITIVLSWFVGRARPPIDVGSDGVTVFGRFIPIAAIRSVAANSMGFEVILSTTEGEIVIPLRDDDGAERARVIAERIREAMSVQGTSEAVTTVLDAKVDDVSEWRENLVEMATSREDYRGVALDPGEMLRVLDDPHAPVRRRLGAAIALHASGGDAAKRIRVCAEAVAEPHFRVALERIADGAADDELIERALGARED